MLTVCASWSQDTIADNGSPNSFSKPVRAYAPYETTDTRPICFPFWMVKAIALDLAEMERLEQEVQLLLLENSTAKSLVAGLELQDQDRQLQLQLLEENLELLEVQLKTEREIKKTDSWVAGALRLLGALGVGFMIGRI